MRNTFHPWHTGLTMTAAALVIALAWALASPSPWAAFVSLARYAVLPLLLPLIQSFVRFLADIARWVWEREEWSMKPHRPDHPMPPTAAPAFIPASPVRSTFAYNVNGRARPDLFRYTEAELHEAAWRECCLTFLQAGHELGDVWTIRELITAGVVTDPEWRLITGVLAGAGLLTTKGGTQPYPDYRAAVAQIRGGQPLPLPSETAPRITRQHTQHAPPTPHTPEVAEQEA